MKTNIIIQKWKEDSIWKCDIRILNSENIIIKTYIKSHDNEDDINGFIERIVSINI